MHRNKPVKIIPQIHSFTKGQAHTQANWSVIKQSRIRVQEHVDNMVLDEVLWFINMKLYDIRD